MHFNENVKITIGKDKKFVTLSIKVTENLVNVYKFNFSEFQSILAKMNAELEQSNNNE